MRTPVPFAPPVDVLIAEDDAPIRSSLRFLLEKEGYTCAEAATGREAVELAQNSPPRCVLLDLGMPEMDGFAGARHLRADPRTRHPRTHCLTGSKDPGAQEQAQQAGCEMFLPKPVDPGALLNLVHLQ